MISTTWVDRLHLWMQAQVLARTWVTSTWMVAWAPHVIQLVHKTITMTGWINVFRKSETTQGRVQSQRPATSRAFSWAIRATTLAQVGKKFPQIEATSMAPMPPPHHSTQPKIQMTSIIGIWQLRRMQRADLTALKSNHLLTYARIRDWLHQDSKLQVLASRATWCSKGRRHLDFHLTHTTSLACRIGSFTLASWIQSCRVWWRRPTSLSRWSVWNRIQCWTSAALTKERSRRSW